MPELLPVEPRHPGPADNTVTAGVEPAHLHVTKLAALCAQGTLNSYLTHVRRAGAMATSPSPAVPLLFSGLVFT